MLELGPQCAVLITFLHDFSFEIKLLCKDLAMGI